MPTYKIMVVEDEKIVAMDIQSSLEKMGYSVCATASSGMEAIKKADLTRPDLILMDIVLKGSMDGIEAAKQIKALHNIPVVYLTAFGEDAMLQKAKITEPYGYIIKPFRERDLQIAIEISIYKKQAEIRIQRMERWLATVLKSIGDAVIASDKDRRITFMNAVAERLTGWNQEDALGKKLTEVIKIKDQDLRDLEKHLIEKVITEGLIINLIEDRILISKDGTAIPISDSAAPIKDDSGQTPGSVLVFRDITETKQAEDDLRSHQVELEMQNEELRRTYGELEASRTRYFDLYELAPVGYCTISEHSMILEANLSAATMLGLTRGALIKQPLSRFILPEDQDIYYRYRKQLFDTQPADSISSQQSCELRMVNQDMGPFWVRLEATTAKSIDSAPVCRVVMSDITERKRAEDEIQRNESRLKRLVDILQYQSETIQDFLDYALAQVIQLTGSKIGYIYHYHEDRKMFVLNTWSKEVMAECSVANPSNCYELDKTGIWGEAVRQRRPIIVNDFKAAHPLKKGYPEGHAHLLKFMTVPIFKKDSIVGVVGLANKETDYDENDILQASLLMDSVWKVTESIYAEQKLQEQFQFLQALMDAIPSPIFYKDTQGIYMGCNSAFAEFCGRTKEEIIGKSVYELWKKELADIYYKADERHLQNPAVQIYEASLMHADGTEHPVIFYKATFNNQDGALGGLIGSFLDISDRKRVEEERSILQERLQRAEKMESLGLLAGGVAHDLNNALGILVGYSELLYDGLDESDPLRDDARNIISGGEQAAAIIQDLLTLARRGAQTKTVINLNKTVTEYLKSPELLKLTSFHPNVRVKTELEKDLIKIAGSHAHISKMLMNLVSNAAEAMTSGGDVTIRTENRYLDRPVYGYDEIQEGDYIVLTVSDEGEGITEDDMKRIFEPFYTKKVMGRSGTGLGLSVVWGTVKDHDGYIDVQSSRGKGTTFNLYFPVTHEEMDVDKVTSIDEYMGHGESILVVDDIDVQRDLAKRILAKLDYRVETVASGEEAVAYLKNNNVELIILDMIMDPGIDGFETYRQISEIRPGQKAIIVSGFAETERVKMAQYLGAGAFVKKPYIKERIGLAVRKELDRTI